jgi:translation initiation factor 2B subunit (eIF-2B alpha/beta/delta family)
MRLDLDEFAKGLAKSQPNMGSVWNVANGILHRSADIGSLMSFCESTADHHAHIAQVIASHAIHLLEGRAVLTTSSSSAVFHSLVEASRRSPVSVHVCESRPMREGVIMARELANFIPDITVIADAALALFSYEADVAVVGADAVNRDGVIGKIGLSHLALACERRNIPVIVLADTSKFAPIGLTRDPRNPGELLDPSCPGVGVENLYFEQVELDRVSTIISEKGRMSKEDAQRAVWGVKVHPKLA